MAIWYTENSSGDGIHETKIDVDIEGAQNNINTITKRTRIFTTVVLILMTLLFTGILLRAANEANGDLTQLRKRNLRVGVIPAGK